MAFKMSFAKDAMSGNTPVAPGIYTVAFIKFAPKKSKAGDSINYNPQVKIVGGGPVDGRMLFTSLNTKIPGFIVDFVHSFGLEMVEDADGDLSIPGDIEGDPNDPTTWKYSGPLIGQTAEFEVGIGEYNGKPNQEMIAFKCKVTGCSERHSSDMRKKG